MIPSNALRKAIYAKLTGNSTLLGMVTGIFDNVPEGTLTPYIKLGQVVTIPQNTMGEKGHVTTFTIDIFSDAPDGFQEAIGIFNEVDSTIDQQKLLLDAPFKHVYTMYHNHQELEEESENGVTTRHIPADYDIYTTGG